VKSKGAKRRLAAEKARADDLALQAAYEEHLGALRAHAPALAALDARLSGVHCPEEHLFGSARLGADGDVCVAVCGHPHPAAGLPVAACVGRRCGFLVCAACHE